MIIDLHMHSNVSDGKLSPADLVRLVHANGVELMALTDHDTMDGVRQASGRRRGARRRVHSRRGDLDGMGRTRRAHRGARSRS